MAPTKRNNSTFDSPARPARGESRSTESPLKKMKAEVAQRALVRAIRDEITLSTVEGVFNIVFEIFRALTQFCRVPSACHLQRACWSGHGRDRSRNGSLEVGPRVWRPPYRATPHD